MKTIQITDTDVLIVIDPQNDFCPGGSLAVAGGDSIMMPINVMQRLFRKAGAGVVITQDWHPTNQISFASRHKVEPFSTKTLAYGDQVLWPDHCVQGTPGADFHQLFDQKLAQMIVRKGYNSEVDSYSGFFENDKETTTGLDGWLTAMGFKRVFLVGLALDYCVRFTAEDAVKLGFEVVVIEDMTRGIAPESIEAAKESFETLNVQLVQADDITA